MSNRCQVIEGDHGCIREEFHDYDVGDEGHHCWCGEWFK